MKRLIMVLALVVAVSSAVHAEEPTWPPGDPFFYITDGAFGTSGLAYAGTISMNMWKNNQWQEQSGVRLGAQRLQSNQAANSSYSWLQGDLNHWYCVDLNSTQQFANWWFYDTHVMDAPFGRPEGRYGTIEGLRRAAWLVDTYHDLTGNSLGRAALQLAVWEAVYDNFDGEDVSTVLNLSSGDFQAWNFSSTEHAAIVADASLWFEDSAGKFGRGVYAVDGQNLLGRTEIPEPGTLILLGLGLTVAGFGVIRRRRKA